MERGVLPIGDWSILITLSSCSIPSIFLYFPGIVLALLSCFASALYKISLIQFNEYISIYKIEDCNIIAEPLEMIPINENEEIVMAEWCSGKYVEQWEKVFIDGEVILDNNY